MSSRSHSSIFDILRFDVFFFPVVDEDRVYLGLVDMDDVREDMFHPDMYENPISAYMIQAKEHISTSEPMDSVMEKFRKTGYYNLPVIDDGKYIGFVSRANIFNAYRKVLKDVSME